MKKNKIIKLGLSPRCDAKKCGHSKTVKAYRIKGKLTFLCSLHKELLDIPLSIQ